MDKTRGPYQSIRWFCADGTVLPPRSYACREHGGGRQHAEYSKERQRLAELGWSVGTVFAALDTKAVLDPPDRDLRLRQLPLERYLVDIDDGWVLRKARDYRGRVQIEDETAAGRALLVQLLGRWDWSADNFLLVRELVRTIPHGEDTDFARRVRRAAVELAEREPRAERWRAEIHAAPTAATASLLRAWATAQRDAETRRMAETLSDDLDQLYGDKGRAARREQMLAGLSAEGVRDWRNLVRTALAAGGGERVRGLCEASHGARATLLAAISPRLRLQILDTLEGLETEVRLAAAASVASSGLSRAEYLGLTRDLVNCAHGAGLLSDTERSSLVAQLPGDKEGSLPAHEYLLTVSQLKRVPGWAVGNIRFAFAEALIGYSALDPRAARFSDDLLRGSAAWVLGDILRILTTDAGRLSGTHTELAGSETAGATALNPGLAAGTLKIFETLESVESTALVPTDIVVLPETLAELTPVAGILTLGEGNALSHVQLLARNFGIPNVAIDPSALDLLRPLEGRRVILVAGSDGTVALRASDETPELEPLVSTAAMAQEDPRLTVPPPDLSQRDPLPLERLSRSLSGKVVGPKAANLGQLNRLFPGRVAPALALPFGAFAEHVDAAGIRTRLKELYDDYRGGQLDAAAFEPAMQTLRSEIAALSLQDDTRDRLSREMLKVFGEPGTYGIFVRSDTNVEDLPEFTGAGLSETIPHVIGPRQQFETIPRVWSSVLSPRAIAWRSNLLTNPEQVFASVLLMKSVPSDKSGVLVTANLGDPGEPGLTVSTAWGIGGAVAGEAAETLIIGNRDTRLVSEAKAPYQRKLSDEGGIRWDPAPSGSVLTAIELDALRDLAGEANARYEPVLDSAGKPRPWDIEFGFVDGELTLFQIRPLVERGALRADRAVALLFNGATPDETSDRDIDLGKPPLTRSTAQ